MSGAFGGGSKKRAVAPPPPPPPSPMPMELQETEEAKRQVRKRGQKGRPSTILAGRLMSERGKKLLGE